MLNGRRAPQLGDLDDHTLLACFSHLTPLPDLFNVAASCRVRVWGLGGCCLWLRCCPAAHRTSCPPRSPPPPCSASVTWRWTAAPGCL